MFFTIFCVLYTYGEQGMAGHAISDERMRRKAILLRHNIAGLTLADLALQYVALDGWLPLWSYRSFPADQSDPPCDA